MQAMLGCDAAFTDKQFSAGMLYMAKTIGAAGLPQILGRQMQMAWVVNDLDQALRYWTAELGVGPFVVFEGSVGNRKVLHRGCQTGFDMSLAFSYIGDMQIEVIAPLNDEPSPYREFLASGREGLHHLGFWPEDFDGACREIERVGFVEACSIYQPDGTKSASYYDAPPQFGTMVELIPMTAQRRDYFGRIRALVDGWNGSDAIRKFRSREEFLSTA
jgi:hypothetical protein